MERRRFLRIVALALGLGATSAFLSMKNVNGDCAVVKSVGNGFTPLIQKVTVSGAPTGQIRLIGLNLVPGKLYKLVASVLSTTTARVSYSLAFNGDYTDSHYRSTMIYRGLTWPTDNTVATLSFNRIWVDDNNQEATPSFQVFDLLIDAKGKVRTVSHWSSYEGSTFEVGTMARLYDGPVSSIAQMDWIAKSTPKGIAPGSFLAVYNTE